MRRLSHISIVLIFILSCKTSNKEIDNWNKINNEKDFSLFFNFALETKNVSLLSDCIDSLEKYKPETKYFILRYLDYFNKYADTVQTYKFYLEDLSTHHYDIKERNAVMINLNKSDTIVTVYSNAKYPDFKQLIVTLFDTSGISYNLPEFEMVIHDEKEYLGRKLVVFINSGLSNVEKNSKSNWETLIRECQNVILAFDEAREFKSQKVFGESYSNLTGSEKKFIINLVPINIIIHLYYSFVEVPPPPPLPKS